MATNREERRLMRQRGAGTHQLRDSGFALNIPDAASTPLQPASSAKGKSTPQNRIPGSGGKSSPHTYSKKTPRSIGLRKYGSSSARRPQGDSQGSVTRTTRRGIASPVKAIIEETVPEEPDGIFDVPDSVDGDQVEADAEGKGSAEAEEPAAEVDTTSKKQKKRKSNGSQSARKKRKSGPESGTQREQEGEPEVSAGPEEQKQPSEGETSSPLRGKTRKSGVSNGPLEPTDENIERVGPTKTTTEESPKEATASSKRPGRPMSKRVAALVEADTPTTATADVTTPESGKRRGRPRLSEGNIPGIESPGAAQSTSKPRGRPRKIHPTATDNQIEDVQDDTEHKTRRGPRISSTKAMQEDETEAPETTTHKPRGRPRKSDISVNLQHGEDEESTPQVKAHGRKRKADGPVDDDPANSSAVSKGMHVGSATKRRGRPRKSGGSTADVDKPNKPSAIQSRKAGKGRAKNTEALAATYGDDGDEEEEEPAPTEPTLKPRGRKRKSDADASGQESANVGSAQASRQSASPEAESQGKPKAKAGAIPVTVHRLSRPRLLNFVEETEDDLAGPAPLMKKAGVNAVDVLAQICREIGSKFTDSLKLNAQREQGSKKAEWKRKRKVVEMFNDQLQARMLQMTTALDHSHGLTHKLRQVNKSKASFRDELLKLRSEREELAIQMDAVRMEHEKNTKDAKGANDLNTTLHDIELAVQRGRAAQQSAGEEDKGIPGVEAQIQRVADAVSSSGGRQGLLDKVKRFNAFLEAAAAAL